VAFFRSQRDAYVPLHLEIDPEPLSWEGGAADITLFGVVEDADGQPARRFEEQTKIQRPKEDGSAVFDIPLNLSPGSFVLNLGILDERSGRMGTKKVPVFVPDFQGDRLRLSSVLLYEDKRQTSQPPGTSGHAFQFGETEFLLRHDKTFQTKGSLGLFFFAYGYRLDNGRKPNLTSHYVLLKDGKLQGQIADQPLQGSSLQAAANIEIPLTDLEPGPYQIEIRVTDLIALETTTERAEFTLKPVPFPIESYSSLVKEYRSGSFVLARNALSNVSLRSLEDAARRFRGEATSDDELKAAALLHTDVAVLTRTAEETLHLKTARDYLARIEDPSSRRDFEHQWFLAVSHHLQAQSTAWSAFPMLDEALGLFPESIEIRLAVASVYEKMGRRGVDGMLELAEELYREILRSDPAHAETRLRLGRILQLQRRSVEALRELGWGLAHTDDPDLKFLAHMLMGESYDRLDDLSGVIESYRSALEIDPDCQCAAIALSHALHRWGDRASSREVMVDYFSRVKKDRADRWWQFVMGSTARGESVLETMRQEIRLE
jgi:tetratricopeptide (TPR) repeat protein